MNIERQIGSGAPDQAIEDEAPGGIVINPHSALGKELRKWEQHHSELTPRGTQPGNPYVYRAFPKMLYRAQVYGRTGQPSCLVAAPDPYMFDRNDIYEREVLAVETFNKSCQRIVHDESEERIAKGQGWAEGPTEALQVFERQQQDIGRAAAEAAFHAKRMSEQAQREFKSAGEETHEHVVDVQPKKRGRKPKAIAGSGPVES